MNIRGLIQGGVDQAWSLLSTDILETITVNHVTRGAYVPASGTVPSTTTLKTVKAARIEERAGLPTDEAASGDHIRSSLSYLVRVKDLPFTPKVGDPVQHQGVVQPILDVKNHANIVWELVLVS